MIDSNDKDINTINLDVTIEECFKELKPHPKFHNCDFDNYFPDDKYPSQGRLKNILQKISSPTTPGKRAWYKPFLNSKPKKIHKNLYIDGTYGIGKTHLLSACFNNFEGKKAFMSFMELTYFMNYAGLEKSIETFKPVELLLIDEFDLDDPATTRMAARFIEAVNERTTIVTTSNRLPEELGGGRFDTSRFARELGVISELFEKISVEGKSFRLNVQGWKAKCGEKTFEETYNNYQRINFNSSNGDNLYKLLINKDKLIELLRNSHPFRFFVIPKTYGGIFISGFEPFEALNDALRFAIFIDHCYYYNTKLFFEGGIKENIFPKEMMETVFERQFLRCLSRLDEMGLFFKK